MPDALLRLALLRLALGDLRRDAVLWLGAALVSAAVAFFVTLEIEFVLDVAAAPDALFAAADSQGSRADYLTLGANLLIFSGAPSVVVLGIVLANVASLTAPTHALWRLGGASPAQVVRLIVTQSVLVALVGTLVGTLTALPFLGRAGDLLLRYGTDSRLDLPTRSTPWLPLATAAVLAALAALAAVLPAGRAARLSPLAVRTGSDARSSTGRPGVGYGLFVLAVLALLVLPLTASVAGIWQVDDPVLAVITTLPLGQAAVLTTVLAAPWVLGGLLRAWTLVFARWTPWHVARHLAAARVATSVAAVSPLVLGVGLIGSLSLVAGTAIEVAGPRAGAVNTFETAVLMGPIGIIAAVGSVAVVVMSARQRAGDIACLRSAGATRRDTDSAVACESVIGTVTAVLTALVPLTFQAGLLWLALGVHEVPATALRMDPRPALLVLAVGGLGSLVAALWSAGTPWRRSMTAQLAER